MNDKCPITGERYAFVKSSKKIEKPINPVFFNVKCCICGRSYGHEEFFRAEDHGIPCYYVGDVRTPWAAEKYYCSPQCGLKDYEKQKESNKKTSP